MSRFRTEQQKLRFFVCDFSQFFVMLRFTLLVFVITYKSRLPILPNLLYSKKFPLYLPFWHFAVSAVKAYVHAKANAANLKIKVSYLMVRVIYSWDSIVFQVSCYVFFKLRVFEQGIHIINEFFNWSKLFIQEVLKTESIRKHWHWVISIFSGQKPCTRII